MMPTPEAREILKRFSLVEHIADDPAKLDTVAAMLQSVTYHAGEEIVRKGDYGNQAFLLVKGAVEIVDYTVDGEPYTKAVLKDINAILFGELALVGNDVRSATVKAMTTCECWVLSREDFIRMGDENPQLGWLVLQQIASLVAQRLIKTNQDVLTLFEALVMEVESESSWK